MNKNLQNRKSSMNELHSLVKVSKAQTYIDEELGDWLELTTCQLKRKASNGIQEETFDGNGSVESKMFTGADCSGTYC